MQDFVHQQQVGLWDILYFPLSGLRGSYLLIFFSTFKSPTLFRSQGLQGLGLRHYRVQGVAFRDYRVYRVQDLGFQGLQGLGLRVLGFIGFRVIFRRDFVIFVMGSQDPSFRGFLWVWQQRVQVLLEGAKDMAKDFVYRVWGLVLQKGLGIG